MEPGRLARVADALGAVDDRPVLDRVVTLCVDLLAVTGATIVMSRNGEHQGAIAVSDGRHGGVDDLQFLLGEGPSLAADRSPGPVLEPDLALAVGLWPAFAPAALERGVYAAFAFPLGIGAVRLGVLTLYRDSPGDLSDADAGDAVTIAQVVTHVLLEMEAGLVPGTLPDRLSEVLDHRAHVHQATGMVAAQLGVDVVTALARLRAYAWSRDRTIDDVAASVVARQTRFDDEDA